MRAFAFTTLALVAIACGGKTDAPVDDGPLGHDARFVGVWAIEEDVAHAGFAAAIYDFGDDGTVTRVRGVSFSEGGADALGAVENGSIHCKMGSLWNSAGPNRLHVVGLCSDDVTRTIVYGFPADASGNSALASVEVLEVGGEAGWVRAEPWGWHMRKCDAAATCGRGW